MPPFNAEDSTDNSTTTARSFLTWMVVAVALIVLIPLALQDGFRKLVGVAMLGVFYSLFLVNLWDRWSRRIQASLPDMLGRFIPSGSDSRQHDLFPVRAWGLVPCFLQFIFLGMIAMLFWFLGLLFYEITKNPDNLGLVRDALQLASPKFYDFLNELTFTTEPMTVIQRNAEQVFTSLNRFVSTILVPMNFLLFTGVGAALYDPIRSLFEQAEGSRGGSEILERYSRLFGEYLLFNSIYNLILGTVFAVVMFVLDTLAVTDFGYEMILGLVVFFLFGNLLVPGLGTLFTTAILVGLLSVWQGWLGGLIAFLIMMGYFLIDDYAIKPVVFTRLGQHPERAWDFGVEVLIFGLVILYASFDLVGALLLFPALCFLDAYLQQQHPDLRPWVLSPLKTLTRDDAESTT